MITSQPSAQTVSAGQPATFSVTATGTGTLSYQWQQNGANIPSANSSSYTISTTTAADNGLTFQVIVSNSAGSTTSAAAVLTVTNAPVTPAGINILTYHNDVGRTGQNLNETILTPGNVNSTGFGKIGFLSVLGPVDAEPLYVSNLTVGGAAHNVVFLATENDLVYAFDADTFAQLWNVSVLEPNEVPSDTRACGQITPNIGVTSTPVIDLAAGPHGTIFLVAMSKDASGNYYQRLHALDLSTGAEQSGSPTTIAATFPGSGANSSNGQVIFDPAQYAERSALLLLNGTIYLAWTSHCDSLPYTGWVMGYNEKTFQQQSVINVTPNGSQGSIWMAGDGLAADVSGNIYFLDANGTFDTTLNGSGFPVSGDYGNSFMKLSTSGNSLAVADYFTMHNTVAESTSDEDLSSGGVMLLPDLTDNTGKVWHLGVGAGKDGNIYVVNRDSMGKFNPNSDTIYQELLGVLGNAPYGSNFSTPAFFNNTIFYGAVSQPLMAFQISNAQLVATPTSQSAVSLSSSGATPSISANGASTGIVWAVESRDGAGVLHAYDATNLANELYNSNQAGSRDQFGANNFIVPMIANGKVYVGSYIDGTDGITVFGLLPSTVTGASTMHRRGTARQ
jgi:Immunoglobulin I-set domain